MALVETYNEDDYVLMMRKRKR